MGRVMWNDEDPREPDRELHQVASSWVLVAVILFGTASWSGLRYLALVAEPIFRTDKAPMQAIPPGEEGMWPRESTAPCTAAAKRSPGEPNAGREVGEDDARPSSPKPPGCESSSTNSYDLPGPALTVEWESLH
jgi:hypothetical protein